MTTSELAAIDKTHDPALTSWVSSANRHGDFPIQNLPFGVFSPPGEAPRGGIAIGEMILDLAQLAALGALSDEADVAAQAASGSDLNPLLALGAGPRRALRREVSRLLSNPSCRSAIVPMLHEASLCALHVPARIGDYTDFYVGIHHASNVGALFRPDNPLLPNYKHIPIGYHGRASSVVASGTGFKRPNGQTRAADADAPTFGPTARLDYELELGVWLSGGNALGEAVPIEKAASQIAGICLLNDWSARDVQAWEYQPLGPFLAKNFATTISPWIVTAEALVPYRTAPAPRPDGDPEPLPYLLDADDRKAGGLNAKLEVAILTPRMRAAGEAPFRLSRTSTANMYWTLAQLVAHHSSGGCNLRAGDLLGSGTISGPARPEYGSLLEITSGGRDPVELPGGEMRRFIEDGDEILLSGRLDAEGFVSIGFGECRGVVKP